jgi:alpha-1,4-digalacturonate transport system permease protein
MEGWGPTTPSFFAYNKEAKVKHDKRAPLQIAPYAFLLPNLVIFMLFIVIPAFANFYLSMFKTSPVAPPKFVGIDNFKYIFVIDDLFKRSLGNLMSFMIYDVAAIVFFSVIIGVMLNQSIRGKSFFRSAFFFPVLLSPVVVALVWGWILNNRFGLLNAALVWLGFKGQPWLLRPDLARAWTVIVHVWATVGFFAIIILAGLQSIPASLYEAAEVDGSTPIQNFFFITLPMLAPSISTVSILSMIRAFEIFDHVYILTGGGPGTATMMVVQYIYRAAFEMDQQGRAAAASLVLFVILLSLALVQYVIGKRQEAV